MAVMAVIAESPEHVDSLSSGRITRARMRTTPAPPGGFKITIEYGLNRNEEPGERAFIATDFSTAGGTQHITQAIDEVRSYGRGFLNTAAYMYGGIGVRDGKPEGVDITVPVFSFMETHKFFASQITQQYTRDLFELTGCTNNNPFRCFHAGEVLFLGVTGGRTSAELFELQFSFSVSKNKSGIRIADFTNINKGGWEYLWVDNVEEANLTQGVLVSSVRAVYIDKVYEAGSFEKLLIGVH